MPRTLSVAAAHSGASFTVGYLMTGSLLIGGVVAVAEPLCNAIVSRACGRIGRMAIQPPALRGQRMGSGRS